MLVGSSIFDCIEMLVLDFIVVVDSVFHVNAESILLRMRIVWRQMVDNSVYFIFKCHLHCINVKLTFWVGRWVKIIQGWMGGFR